MLRPPRVAILFRDDEAWQAWARLAIATASGYWGGAGYAFVPYSADGTVNPAVVRGVVTFDPDYVAVMTHDGATWFNVAPDAIDLRFPEGTHPAEHLKLIENLGPVSDPAGNNAAKTLISRCAPLSFTFDRDRSASVQHFSAGPPQDRAAFLPSPRPGMATPDGALSVSRSWTGPLTLFAAARIGIAPNDERTQGPDDGALLDWVVDPVPKKVPEELLWFTGLEFSDHAQRHQTWFEASSPDLSTIRTGFPEDQAAIVIGESAADFALAVLYERMLGYCLWLTPDLLEEHFEGNWLRKHSLDNRLRDGSLSESIPVVSASLSDAELERWIRALAPTGSTVVIEGESLASRSANLVVREPNLSRGLLGIVLAEHLGATQIVPVVESSSGTLTLEAPVRSPIPTRARPRCRHSARPHGL